ncbi:MAG: phage baseplate assembly protein V [Candidatus Symbiothrix sp.]|jgi:uncharacterized protein involved in type VI secretion and phage assembly|nr:phage baseplate assembly protein V [Candidatus Symbiothrix sp.]
MAELNLVETSITISGQKVHFARLNLFQKFNAHHHVEIEIDFEEFGGKWMDDPTKMIKYIGEDLNIIMKHRQTGEQNLFAGIITNVSFSGYHGQQNSVIITGASPTIKLDGMPAMDSFMDLPLQQIVKEAVSNSGNGCSVTANPKFGSKLDYVCQYNESCFDFLNRLSWQFGEWFFYDGQDTCFGLKYGNETILEYDREMTYFDLSANLTPQKFNRYQYLKHDDRGIDTDDQSGIPGVRGYLQVAKSRSESVYTSEVTAPLMPDINTKKDLDDLVKAEKSRAVGGMLIMRGKTQTCKVKIGDTVKIRLPKKMDVAVKSVDTFLVTQVTHVVDQEGHYSNSFEAIIDGIEAIPMAEPRIPIAGSQIATVKSNDDPRKQGRVKVEFQWQKRKNKTTNWVRVQAPDAGSSGKVSGNRGLVTIPETGDTVMIGFEFSNPDRPFVAGSVFTSRTGTGGGGGNKTKSLTTRSGSTITFDDDKNDGNITISDPSGNTIVLNGDKTISISAPDKISITSKEIIINGSDLVHTLSDKMIKEESKKDIVSSASQNIDIKGNSKVIIEGTASLEEKSAKVSIAGQANVAVDGTIINITGTTSTSVKGMPLTLN